MDLIEEYRWRGMMQDLTEGAAAALAAGPLKGYIGFDPTADSLHVGSLMPIMGLVHLQRHGHTPIALVGGGTGLIGDPSGKSEERQLLSRDEVMANQEGIRQQLAHFLDFQGANAAVMANNLDWLGPLSALDLLRDVGKHFSVNAMLRKESVRRRLEDDEGGLSYTEFSYLVLQAYDFLALYQRTGCTLQLGGSDQWGNITSGTDLIRRVEGAKAFGVVFPLVAASSGVKFGKTEAGTIWLDPRRTSPYRFFQFWLNTDDNDAARYLRFFTLLEEPRILELEAEQAERPQERSTQRALAEDVTRRVHGETGLTRARQATEVLFGGSLDGISGAEVADIFADVPAVEVSRNSFEAPGMGMVDLLATAGVSTSRGDARRSIEGGGIYVNNVRVADAEATVVREQFVDGRFLILRKGKKNYTLVRIV